MASAPTIALFPTRSAPPVLHGVSWRSYESLLQDAESEDQRVFLTFFRGDLEIMPPLPMHEHWKVLFGWLIEALDDELGIGTYALASSTFRREDVLAGLEPDACYYIQHARDVIGKARLNLSTDPPPDLAIEVDLMHRSLDRQPVYAALGVPELWRYKAGRVEFFALGADGKYDGIERSRSFPFLAASQLAPLFEQLPQALDAEVRRYLRAWARQTFAA